MTMTRPKPFKGMRAYFIKPWVTYPAEGFLSGERVNQFGTVNCAGVAILSTLDNGESIDFPRDGKAKYYLLPGEPNCPEDPLPPIYAQDIQQGDQFWVRMKDNSWTKFTCDVLEQSQWRSFRTTHWCEGDVLEKQCLYIPPSEDEVVKQPIKPIIASFKDGDWVVRRDKTRQVEDVSLAGEVYLQDGWYCPDECQYATEEQILKYKLANHQAEVAKLQSQLDNLTKLPQPKQDIDWQPLLDELGHILEDQAEYGISLNNCRESFGINVLEAALECAYGADVFNWWSKQSIKKVKQEQKGDNK